MRNKLLFPLFLSSCLVCSPIQGAQKKPLTPTPKHFEKLSLVGINIVDRNGLSETISSKEKLKKYATIDFLQPQPYKKVARIYKNRQGESVSCLTSYHNNGQIHQYLECLNNRANGRYREWHANGKLKIQALVIGGIADLHPSAQSGWIFDGVTLAYNDDGILIASVKYEKGLLEGESVYYHNNGLIWKKTPYHKGLAHGDFLFYSPSGNLIKKEHYLHGKKEGLFVRYLEISQQILAQELFDHDLLVSGTYFNIDGEQIAEVANGFGEKAFYSKHSVSEIREIRNGKNCGLVKVLDVNGQVCHTYNILDEWKHGEEIFYHPNTTTPRLLLTWKEGVLHGPVKSWYLSGAIESSKDLVLNKKNGVCTFRYPDGRLMATEEYSQDILIKGEYFRPGDKTPYSKVEKGFGVATFFSETGSEVKKIWYQEGIPSLQ